VIPGEPAVTTTLSIERLGPLRDTTIELGDVTFIFGPPNSGKSYTLRAIYENLLLHDPPVVRTCLAKRRPPGTRLVRIEAERVAGRRRGQTAIKVKVCVNPGRVAKAVEEVLADCVRTALLPPHSVELHSEEDYMAPRGAEKLARRLVEVFAEKLQENYPDARLSTEGNNVCATIPELRHDIYIAVKSATGSLGMDEGDIFDEIMLRTIVTTMLNGAAGVSGLVEEALRRLIAETAYGRVVYAAYGRSLLSQAMLYSLLSRDHAATNALEALLASRNLPALSLYHALHEGLRLLRERPRLEERLRSIFAPLLGGRVELGDAEITYASNGAPVPLNMASALAGEAVALMLAAAAVAAYGRGLLLVEEPEAQLHPRYQLLVPPVLYAATSLGARAVVTTHSPLVVEVAARLAHMAQAEPERLEASLADLVEKAGAGPGELPRLAAEALPRLRIRFYYLDGHAAREIKAEHILEGEMPSHTEVLDRLTEWTLDTYKLTI